MLRLPHLADVVVSQSTGNPTPAATLTTNDGDCACVVGVPNGITAGYVQVALDVDVSEASPRHADLTRVAEYHPEDSSYTVSFVLARAEGAEIIKRLFGADLVVTYRFHVDDGSGLHTVLNATLVPKPRQIIFALPEGDPRSTVDLWLDFRNRVTAASTSWGAISTNDCMAITIGNGAQENLVATLLELVRLFSFGPLIDMAPSRTDALQQQREGRDLRPLQ